MINPSQEPIEQVFSRLSHELRTPITSLQGAIALLQGHQLVDESDVESLLALAAESTDRLTKVIEAILDWHQITQNNTRLFKQPCHIQSILHQVIDSLHSFATHKDIAIYLEISNDIPFYSDQYFLTRAFTYLLDNAIKFSPPKCPVYITTNIYEHGGLLSSQPYLQITVKDQGAGIPESDIEAIFQPFHQIDASDTRCHGGLGLELAICREIIRQHQGHIWAESTLGQGTTFYVVLPLDGKKG